ncbi:MAG TPA: hypothetical protein VNT30_07415 [Stellaceae bacterium]|nr:hypothetical protein [Stellaceae bacterium]
MAFSGFDQTKALMIVGVAIDHYDTYMGEINYSTVRNIDLIWDKWDVGTPPPVTGHFRPIIMLHIDGCGVFSGSDCDLRRMQYYVLEATPGDYRLVTLKSRVFNVHNQTTVMDNAQLITHFGPGEIIYIGDLTLNAADSPIRPVRFARNDAAARQVLAGYPNIRGDIVFRQPFVIPR